MLIVRLALGCQAARTLVENEFSFTSTGVRLPDPVEARFSAFRILAQCILHQEFARVILTFASNMGPMRIESLGLRRCSGRDGDEDIQAFTWHVQPLGICIELVSSRPVEMKKFAALSASGIL